MDKNNEVIENLKKVTIEEIINILANNINGNVKSNNKEEQKNILSINEIVEEYPIFSRYSLEKAIRENNLPFIKLGNKKFFERKTIEKWLVENNTTIGKKKSYDI